MLLLASVARPRAAALRAAHVRCSAVAAAAASTAVVRLKGGKARLFKNGHPLVFGGAVGQVTGEPDAGGVVDVVDGKGSVIGWGVYNPHSMYRVRLLATHEEDALLAHRDLGQLISYRLQAAAKLRAACGLPSSVTTAYRLVNSEGDRLSGLTVDVFAGTAVAVTSALWLEQRSEIVVECLRALPGIDDVVWRRSDGRLQQDGWVKQKEVVEEVAADELAPAPAVPPLPPPPPPLPVLIRESGVKYLVAPVLGQKSGFYCDQRDNRKHLAELCAGKRVLDLFCYSGGFSISAARAGASRCVGVDSSALALELARENAQLNGHGAACGFVQADVHKFLREVHEGPRDRAPPSFANHDDARGVDIVICDPPKLAPSVKDLARATPKYRKLNGLAMRSLKPGGLLLSCTCSAAMTQSGGFVTMLQEAAQAEGRALTVLRVTGPAADHVIHPACPESSYLTAVLAFVL